MPVTMKTRNMWKTAIAPVKNKDDIRKVSDALKVLLDTTGNVAWLAAAKEVQDALDAIKQKRKLAFATGIAALASELQTEINTIQKLVDDRTKAETLVEPGKWLDQNLPHPIDPKNDAYGVVGETDVLRKFRRACFDLELTSNAVNTRRCTLKDVETAINAPLVLEDGVRYWSPGSRCHLYSEKIHQSYGGVHDTRMVDLRATLREQRDAYIDVVFGDGKPKQDQDCIKHSFARQGSGARAVVHDGTYLQFFKKFPEFNWKKKPPVFSGTVDQFKRLF